MKSISVDLPPGKKIYFASDFHLGIPDHTTSLQRERLIVDWLDQVKNDCHSIYLLGDIFDFWFEYKQSVPKGFIRLQGKLAELRDAQIPVYFFTGNHDMWMFDYFTKELDIPIFRNLLTLQIGKHKFLMGHGDGLGPGDTTYKILKKFFNSKICQGIFQWIHPNIGMAIAKYWSKKSRINNLNKETFEGEEREFLLSFARQMEAREHHDFYIFGHRHLPLDISVTEKSRYINLGEWVHFTSYAEYDGLTVTLKSFNER